MSDPVFDIGAHLAKEFGSEQLAIFNRRAEARVIGLLRQLRAATSAAPDTRIPGATEEDSRMAWMLQTASVMSAYLIAENARAGVPAEVSLNIFTLLLRNNVETALGDADLLERIRKAVA